MRIVSRSLLALLGGCLLVSCATGQRASLSGDGVFKLPGADAERPRLRYLDGQVSRNDTCMIRVENGLNPAVPPMYVNGEPVGFC